MIYLTAGFGPAVGSSCRLWKCALHAAADSLRGGFERV